MAQDAILVDLDGTVWDSYPWYSELLAATGRVSKTSALSELRSGASIVSLLRRCGVSDTALARHSPGPALFPGVATALEDLVKRKIPIGAVTNLPGRLVFPMLTRVGLREAFPTVVHAGNCRLRKPHPGPLLMALRDLGVSPSTKSLYVGDMARDAEAAVSAGVAFAWASYGYGAACPARTTYVLQSFTDILDL